jgi:hypothetical protein
LAGQGAAAWLLLLDDLAGTDQLSGEATLDLLAADQPLSGARAAVAPAVSAERG